MQSGYKLYKQMVISRYILPLYVKQKNCKNMKFKKLPFVSWLSQFISQDFWKGYPQVIQYLDYQISQIDTSIFVQSSSDSIKISQYVQCP